VRTGLVPATGDMEGESHNGTDDTTPASPPTGAGEGAAHRQLQETTHMKYKYQQAHILTMPTVEIKTETSVGSRYHAWLPVEKQEVWDLSSQLETRETPLQTQQRKTRAD
jgi:hypothetical protein